MSKRKCGCVFADAHNSSDVRHGYAMSGYLLRECEQHESERMERQTARVAKQAMLKKIALKQPGERTANEIADLLESLPYNHPIIREAAQMLRSMKDQA